MSAGVFSHIRRKIVGGLLLVLPLLITLWLLKILFDIINDNVTPQVMRLLQWANVPGLEGWVPRTILIPLIGIVLTVGAIYLLGLMAGNLFGRRVLGMIERYILKVPLVKGVYGSARQLLDAFTVTGKKAFSKVVVVEYPRRGTWTVGFVTSEVLHAIPRSDGQGSVTTVAVFLPTTPNPTSGWMLLVPRDELHVLDMTIDEGIKLIVSGGIVSPDDLGGLLRGWGPEPKLPASNA